MRSRPAGFSPASAGHGLVTAGTLVTVAALLGPWTWRQGEAHGKPAATVLLAIALLGPALTALCVATRRQDRLSAAVAATGAATATAIAARAAAGESTLDGLAPGGPLAAVACAAAAVGWLIIARAPGPVAPRRLAASTAVVILLITMGYAIVRWTATTEVTHVVVDRHAPAESPPPGVESEKWHTDVTGDPVAVAAGLLLLREPAGLTTLDAATGKPAWRYLRRGSTTVAAGVSADGTVVAGWWQGLAVGFDAATGERRWQRPVSGSPATLVGAEGWFVAVMRDQLIALDARTGRRGWTWRPGSPECVVTSAVPTGDARLAVVLTCPGGIRVAGVSTVDAVTKWTFVPDETGPATVARAPGGVLVVAGRSGVVLSASTGTAGARHVAPAPLSTVAERTVLYLGESSSAVDLAYGRPLWTVPGFPARAAAGAYVIGSGRLRWLDVSTGATRAERPIPDAASALFLGPGVVLVTGSNTVTAYG